jgi:AraC family transcriptional regulator, regulatory protein of adaptative response / methylated-DNA-[protein]-cysteine methyltransferase
MQANIIVTHFKTPLGEMIAGAIEDGLVLFDFSNRRMIEGILTRIRKFHYAELEEGEHPHFILLKAQIKEYLDGNRKQFELPLVMSGTPFQKKVWEELLNIPYGETRSYKQQAIAMGDVSAIRAVARANGENCFAVVIPCHRVIAENGDLTGYAGGLAKKKWLLNFEKKNTAKELQTELFE